MRTGKSYLKLIVVILFVLVSVIAVTRAGDTQVFQMKGVEIAKGIDLGAIRFGMTTIGKVFSEEGEVGSWLLRIHFKNREDIEVCDGTNDIVWFKLEISFTEGELAGHQLVLGMTDWLSRYREDVLWSYYTEPCCLGGLDCECPGVDFDVCSGDYSNLASIPNVTLNPWWGTTLPVKNAWVQDGWLCHQYMYIPRVSGELVVVLP